MQHLHGRLAMPAACCKHTVRGLALGEQQAACWTQRGSNRFQTMIVGACSMENVLNREPRDAFNTAKVF